MSLWEQDDSGAGDTVNVGSGNGNGSLGTDNTAHMIVSFATQCSNSTSSSINMISMTSINMLGSHEISVSIIVKIINNS